MYSTISNEQSSAEIQRGKLPKGQLERKGIVTQVKYHALACFCHLINDDDDGVPSEVGPRYADLKATDYAVRESQRELKHIQEAFFDVHVFEHKVTWLECVWNRLSVHSICVDSTGTGEYYFPCSADHEQDWQPYPVDPYSAICDDHTYIHTYIVQP